MSQSERQQFNQDVEQLETNLAQWRSKRIRGERIPEEYFNEAVRLAEKYSISRVSNRLKIDYNKISRIIEEKRIPKSNEPDFIKLNILPEQQGSSFHFDVTKNDVGNFDLKLSNIASKQLLNIISSLV